MIHTLSDCQSQKIPETTNIWQYVIVLPNASIGEHCNICAHCFIENDVVIGNNVTVKSGVYIWNGIQIGNNVFVGPNVTFTNDKRPRSKQYPNEFQKIIINDFASIGAGAIILGGSKIGKYSMVGAGSLVNKDVPERALVYGSPAKIQGWLNDDGSEMVKDGHLFIDSDGNYWEEINESINRK
jgi:UDP-2-acetamido-3-amino-2,3-dideoxy-glucuronate N-acetyltransferase